MSNVAPTELVLASAAGSTGGLGKIGTVPAAGTLYVRCPNDTWGRTDHIGWRVQCNKAHTVQTYRARVIACSVAMTLTALDATDTIIINGLTFEGKAGAAEVATLKFSIDTGDTETAVSLAACINDATYGVPGVTATPAAAVVTLVPTTATVVQAVVGTATAGECGIVQTILPGLIKDASSTTGIADNSATAGTMYEQWIDGFPQAYIAITNNDGAVAATVVVAATRY